MPASPRPLRPAGLPRLVLIALLCLSAAACVEVPLLHGTPESGSASDAENWYHSGEFDRAAQAFLALADSERAQRDHYRLRAAEAFREEGDLPAAARALEGVQVRRLTPDEGTRVDLLGAELALSRHDTARALTLLTQPEADLPPPLRTRLYELRARAQLASGDAFGSSRTRATLAPLLVGRDRAQDEAQLTDLLTQIGPDALRQQTASLAPGDPLRPYAEQVLQRRGVAGAPQPPPNQPVGTLGEPNAPSGEGYRPAHVIGLLLPLGSNVRGVAQAIRDGVFAALFADTHLPRPEVRVYDSGNNDADAVAAYQRAVADGADHVIGPLRREAVSAVFAQPRLPAPVLALNQPDRGDPAPRGSAAFALTPDAEGAQVAQHMIDAGITRAAIIVAASDWGERAAAAFRAQFEAQHGSIAGEARVRDGEVNSANAIRQATGSLSANDGAGVFIAMLPQQARLLLPQLRLARQADRVYATSHIYSGILNAGLDHDLDGVEFCDAPWLFDAVVGLPRHGDIAASLESARGAGARLFAMGLDAYTLVGYLDFLGQHHDSYVPGATGQLTTDDRGRVQRVLVWARFTDGVAQPLNGGLSINTVSAR